jgi:hypothetical protein
MNVIKNFLASIGRFFRNRSLRRLFFLCVLGIFAIADFLVSGLVRRTFVFYSIDDGTMTVEDRMLRRSAGTSESRELDIRRYVEEALLGPLSPESALLFPRETRLRSFLYRDGTVYADLSGEAVLPPLEGGDVFRGMLTLNQGIRRNFPFVRDVRLFIAGKEAYFERFRGIFAAER